MGFIKNKFARKAISLALLLTQTACLTTGEEYKIPARAELGALSDIYPDTCNGAPCRKLTSGEISYLQEAYGNRVDYAKIRIQVGRSSQTNVHGGISKDGVIVVFNREYQKVPDFSKYLDTRHFLDHEVFHDLELSLGKNLTKEDAALRKDLKDSGKPLRSAYEYKPEPGKPLDAFNLEQRAEMMADYRAQLSIVKGMAGIEKRPPNAEALASAFTRNYDIGEPICERIPKLEKLLEPYLETKRTAVCEQAKAIITGAMHHGIKR